MDCAAPKRVVAGRGDDLLLPRRGWVAPKQVARTALDGERTTGCSVDAAPEMVRRNGLENSAVRN
jgi:hypothetical protein